jgi:hypothetical protein
MINYSILAQIVIAVSIAIVWVFRFDNIVREFQVYRIPSMLRNVVGASKIVFATLLVTGIWYPDLVMIPALLMAGLMICAQLTHVRAKSRASQFVPSLVLLVLSLFVAGVHSGLNL